MKQQKKRVSYIKTQKATNIEWILNLLDQIPKYQLQQCNLRKVVLNQFKGLQECDQILKSDLYTYNIKLGKFTPMTFTLYPNLLICDTADYLILSTTLLQKKIIQYKEFTAQGAQLFNAQGNLFLFYESYVQQLNWEKQLKRFCKQQNFNMKYTIKEKLSVQNHFACVKNKNNRVYTVQLIRHTHLNDQVYEALMNEINILMCFKQSGLNQFHAIFEDGDLIYILYEYWVGDTLFKLIQQGFRLNSVQIASIIFQITKVARFLNQNNLYHGNIIPTNIILHRNNNNIQTKVTLFNFSYREENTQNWSWLLKKLPKAWIPPEPQIDPQNIDSYQIGALLYYLNFYQTTPIIKQLTFNKSVENFNIDYQQLIKLKSTNQDYSYSLMDLLCQLLDPEPSKRISLNNIIAHQWLINQRSKSLVQNQQDKPKVLASLRTILELREQSSNEIASSRMGREDQHIDSSSEEEDEEVSSVDNLHRIAKENNCIQYFLNLINLTPIKHPSRKQVVDQFQLSQM